MSTTDLRLAFLGLGAMGSRMAHRLLRAGHHLTVFSRDPRKAKPLEEAGARSARSPKAAVEGAEIVLSMVTDDQASKQVWLDEESGALAALGSETLAIESSTLSPRWAQELSQACQHRGIGFLDAPVAGSRPQAEAGQLIFFVGGEAMDLERARPVLEVLGSAIHPVGPAGRGMTLKLAVNAFFGIQVAALAEVLGLARGGGLETSKAAQIFQTLPVTSPALAGATQQMADGNFAPLFPIDLVAKDLQYVGRTTIEGGGMAPLTASALELFEEAQRQDLGGENISAIARLFG